MKRAIGLVGSLLTVVGIAILAYVGISYAQIYFQPASPHWSSAQQKKGREIATKLNPPQQVKIPKALQRRHLPAPGSEPPTRIIIPKVGVNAPVVQTAPVAGIWNVADWAVGHLTTTPEPGAAGNMALSAHDDIKGEVFKRLGELKPGDKILVRTHHVLYTYVVVDQKVVAPTDISVLNPTRQAVVTLITCTPYWVDTERLVVQGILQSRSRV